jgi:methionine-rich copper-binding protein CopC
MKFRSLMLASALIGFVSAAQAHAHLTKSMPEDKSILSTAPSHVMLHFSEAAHLTALTLQKDGEKAARKLAPLPQESAAEFTLPVESLPAGAYTVNWRVVGDDSHIMSGTLHFTVAPGK